MNVIKLLKFKDFYEMKWLAIHNDTKTKINWKFLHLLYTLTMDQKFQVVIQSNPKLKLNNHLQLNINANYYFFIKQKFNLYYEIIL